MISVREDSQDDDYRHDANQVPEERPRGDDQDVGEVHGQSLDAEPDDGVHTRKAGKLGRGSQTPCITKS